MNHLNGNFIINHWAYAKKKNPTNTEMISTNLKMMRYAKLVIIVGGDDDDDGMVIRFACVACVDVIQSDNCFCVNIYNIYIIYYIV